MLRDLITHGAALLLGVAGTLLWVTSGADVPPRNHIDALEQRNRDALRARMGRVGRVWE